MLTAAKYGIQYGGDLQHLQSGLGLQGGEDTAGGDRRGMKRVWHQQQAKTACSTGIFSHFTVNRGFISTKPEKIVERWGFFGKFYFIDVMFERNVIHYESINSGGWCMAVFSV